MITGIITSFKEPRTICKCIASMLQSFMNTGVEFEIIVLAPDEETLKEARSYEGVKTGIKVIQDSQLGKPAALNIAFKEAKGDILILTDGDTYISNYTVRELLKSFTHPNIGAVSGRPISISPRNTKLGFWSHLLSDMAHETRLDKMNFVVSGYLYAVRKSVLNFEVPKDCLSDDAYISYKIINQGFKILYAPTAQVMVKYPDTFKDWINQKKRSTGGYIQLSDQYHLDNKSRTFGQEASGIFKVLSYSKNIKELFWTKLLILARIYLWLAIFYERKILNKSFEKTWTRIESTK